MVDFSQFLSGPLASLRLADLGARVIKVERPGSGDICRHLYASDTLLNGMSTVFHAINRNKESVALDIKNEADRKVITKLIERADVVIHNFRPGVMERLGYSYERVRQLNPRVLYGEISGYGTSGPWKDKPGQDLLLQAMSGLMWLSGNADAGPVPMGLSIVDMFAGANLCYGLLACLYRRSRTHAGAHVQVSMLETAIDIQFETITTYYKDGGCEPLRTASNSAHAYLGAPYGIYRTEDGYLALAMASIPQLARLLECPALADYREPAEAFEKRDEIKVILAGHLRGRPTRHWLSILETADIWCADVLDWHRLLAHDGFKALDMFQQVAMGDGFTYPTTRCPIRIDGEVLKAVRGAPALGEHNQRIMEELYG